MQNAVSVIVTDVGEYQVPATVQAMLNTVPTRKDGQPDKRHALGNQAWAYIRRARAESISAYLTGKPYKLPTTL